MTTLEATPLKDEPNTEPTPAVQASGVTNVSEPGFFKSFAGSAAKYVFIATLVACAGLAWLWQDAKADFQEADVARASLKVRYDSLIIQQELKEKSDKVNEAIIADLRKQLDGKSEQVDGVSLSIKSKVSAIEAKYSKLDRTETNRIAQEREISAERVRGAWATYCIANPKHELCNK